jgi:uncharacterized membrane protein (DUF4010 family)
VTDDHDARQIALGLAVSAAIGLLVGMERERRSRADEMHPMAGVRTFPLIALGASLSSLLYPSFGAAVVALPMFGLLVLLGVAMHWRHRTSGLDRTVGMTTAVAALVTWLIGLVPFAEGLPLGFQARQVLALALGGVTMAALAMRTPLHVWAQRLSSADMYATVQFLLLAAVVLPLLPDEELGPYGALNPFTVGVVVVVIAAISFFGYVAVRVLGARRGVGLTGLFGGLASSTAVTLTFSQRGRETPAIAPTAALAIVLASGVMFPRLALELAVVSPGLLAPTAVALTAMLAASALAAWLLWRRARRDVADGGREPQFANPFSLRSALKLGLVFAVVRVVVAAASDWFGTRGLLVSAALAGLTDVNAIALSVAGMFRDGRLGGDEAAAAVLLAAGSNTVSKAGLALALGGRRVGLPVAAAFAGVLAVGAVAWWLQAAHGAPAQERAAGVEAAALVAGRAGLGADGAGGDAVAPADGAEVVAGALGRGDLAVRGAVGVHAGAAGAAREGVAALVLDDRQARAGGVAAAALAGGALGGGDERRGRGVGAALHHLAGAVDAGGLLGAAVGAPLGVGGLAALSDREAAAADRRESRADADLGAALRRPNVGVENGAIERGAAGIVGGEARQAVGPAFRADGRAAVVRGRGGGVGPGWRAAVAPGRAAADERVVGRTRSAGVERRRDLRARGQRQQQGGEETSHVRLRPACGRHPPRINRSGI